MLEAYKAFLERRAGVTLEIHAAPYNWYQLPNELPTYLIAYSQMLNEHARELANSLNEMRQFIINLKGWSEVLDQTESYEKRRQIVFEFVNPVATLAINLPYVIRTRFVYSITHLSHQANQLKQLPWSDDLPIDNRIYSEKADKYAGTWKKYSKLKRCLEKISNKKYQANTLNFRNKYNHRYSPRIELGITNLVTRYVGNNGEVSYGIGCVEPLKLKEILPLLIEQHSMSMRAFILYQDLVNEHISLFNQS